MNGFGGLKKPTRRGILMKPFQRGAYRKTNMLGSLALSLGVLVMLPSLSPTEAQSNKDSGQTKHAIVDNGVDSLERLSTSMELLSKRVSPSVVQIFSTGYGLDTDPER